MPMVHSRQFSPPVWPPISALFAVCDVPQARHQLPAWPTPTAKQHLLSSRPRGTLAVQTLRCCNLEFPHLVLEEQVGARDEVKVRAMVLVVCCLLKTLLYLQSMSA